MIAAKRIGIMTIFRADNYGAELQAHALQRKLESMGYDAEVIDYPFYKNPVHRPTRLSSPLFPLPPIRRVKEACFPLLTRLRELPWCRTAARRHAAMERFHREHTRLSPRTFRSMDELYAATMRYDVFMTGSDQVWNPQMLTSMDPYFLTFAPSGARRVAYAASFGVARLPLTARSLFADRLARYDAISVREAEGVSIVRDLIGRDPEHVLDPTLLLTAEQWATVAEPTTVQRPYVLLYELFPSLYTLKIALVVAQRLRAQLVRLGSSPWGRHGLVVGEAGPAQFLGLFRDAAGVVTNSFHGTAFACSFDKPFLSVVPRRMANSGRLTGLLDRLGLTAHLLVEGAPVPEDVPATPGRDAALLLAAAREHSVRYLRQALGNG